MGKQHRGFKKDIDLLSEAYGVGVLGGAHMTGMGLAQQAADHMREEDGEDNEHHNKTGDMSDAELKKVIVEEWIGLENDMTRQANNKKRRKDV